MLRVRWTAERAECCWSVERWRVCQQCDEELLATAIDTLSCCKTVATLVGRLVAAVLKAAGMGWDHSQRRRQGTAVDVAIAVRTCWVLTARGRRETRRMSRGQAWCQTTSDRVSSSMQGSIELWRRCEWR